MNFRQTVNSIAAKHASECTPFPDYFRALKKAGVKLYTVFLQPNHCIFEGSDGDFFVSFNEAFDSGPVSKEWTGNSAMPIILKNIQEGKMDYKRFLKESALVGVHHYSIDFIKYEARYYSETRGNVHCEQFPESFRS